MLEKFIEKIKVSLEDPLFYERVFSLVCRSNKEQKDTALKRVCLDEYDILSRQVDRSKIQESVALRNVLRARRLAVLLFDDEGVLLLDRVEEAIGYFVESLYSTGPDRQHDGRRQRHILRVLQQLKSNPSLQLLMKQVSKPFSNQRADQIIRDTLNLSTQAPVTDAETKRAVLSAWLSDLRQSVGSCFATAPAILVHKEQPHQFLKDLIELLGTGRLIRTFGGIEHSVPLSPSWGTGDLRRPFLISRKPQKGECEPWLSPGVLAACEAVGIFAQKSSQKSVWKRTKALIYKILAEWPGETPIIMTSSEELIRKLLLSHHNLTENDLEEYENRPRGMIQSEIFMHMAGQATASQSGKGAACRDFLDAVKVAKRAFLIEADNALLKTWEYTVASFAETKASFTRWNLFASLGLNAEDEGGIGFKMYEVLKEKLDQCNQQVHEYQGQIEILYPHIQQMENRLRRASPEEAKWMRSQFQARLHEFRSLEEMRDLARAKAHRYANLFNVIVDQYYTLFQKYFQEIYDADMHEVEAGPYDDSPAGFRLLYKHGRTDTSQWTLIYDHHAFVEALASFFTATETEMRGAPEFEGLDNELAEIITAIVTHVRTDEFLESALYRMAVKHQGKMVENPLQNLDKIDKKPWVYTSGGSIDNLMSSYFRLESKPEEVSRWVENPTELLVFLVDTIKQLPQGEFEAFKQNPEKLVLMHSPTHAFLLKAGHSLFCEAWKSPTYTYTWVRDYLIAPMEQLTGRMLLDEAMMRDLITLLEEEVPIDFRRYFRHVFQDLYGRLSPKEFRNELIFRMEKERGLQYGGRAVLDPDQIDSLLFYHLPLFPTYQMEDKLTHIFEGFPEMPVEVQKAYELAKKQTIPTYSHRQHFSAQQLQNTAKALLTLATGQTSVSFDLHQNVARTAQRLEYALPLPVIFADTNWVKDDFAFVINPGTRELELWRVDPTGTVGAPMSAWRHWVDGSRQDIPWGVYHRLHEYSS